jgi:serine/threonine protein kinase
MLTDSGESVEYPNVSRTVAVGTVIRDRFVLEEEIEYGRLGVVYRAADRQRSVENGQKHHVALLVMPAEMARRTQALDLLKHDFVHIQALVHSNIVKVFDLDRDGDLHFMTMDLVDGESLRCILDSLRPELLWEEEAFAVIRAIGDALAYAHARGVIHGDVRLENVLVTGTHEVKVLFTSACLTKNAPFSVDPRDDVHGLACAAYELLAGESPFVSRRSLLTRQRGGEPKRIKTLSRQQWKTLRAALVGRDQSPRSVGQFLADFGIGDSVARRSRPGSAQRSMGWRFVATAWLAVFLGAAYVLIHDGADDGPGDGPVAEVSSDERGTVQATEEDVDRPPPLQSSSFSNLDGRMAAVDPAGVLEQRMPATVRSPAIGGGSPSANASGGTIAFAEAAVTAAESEGIVKLEITRAGGTGELSVTWWTTEGTANAEDDYADFGDVVETFRNGEESRVIFIPVTSDRVPEGREFFRVHLRANPVGSARLGEITQVTVTLVDDDY